MTAVPNRRSSDGPATDPIVRAEFEERLERMDAAMRLELARIRTEMKEANDRQDEEWNKGFRAIREDQARSLELVADGIKQIRQDLKSFVTNDVFVARITPVQAVAYGLVALLMSLMTGMLAMGMMKVGK